MATEAYAETAEKGTAITSGEMIPYWIATVPPQFVAPLKEDILVDAAIIGAGIAGLTIGYLLSKEGLKVAILDDGPVGGGETGRTTAHLTYALDDRYFELEKMFGPDGARLAAQSHYAAIREIEGIITEQNIDCDFRRLEGFLFLHPTDKQASLDHEMQALHRAGFKDVTMIKRSPLASFDTGPCLVFPDQAQFHPMKYLRGLSGAILKMGSQIFTQTRAQDFYGEGVTTADGYRVSAKSIIIATNTPINDRVLIHTKQAAYRSYVVGAKMPSGLVHHALYWDTGNQNESHRPYHYIRTQKMDDGNDLLIIGGEDHKTGQGDPELHFEQLESWSKERFPFVQNFDFRWSGQVIEPADSLAFIGRNPMDKDNVYIATGDSGNGMTHGTIAGILLRDLILGRENPWTNLYDPARKTLSAVRDYLEENMNVAIQYADFLKPGDIRKIEDLSRGQGAILKDGLDPLAVYRDETGKVHTFSALCPHLKCIVTWNSEEKSFDCPCHGSRFTAQGEVVNGPAIRGLKAVEKKPAL